ncbi:MAG: sulfatase [Acidobacteria bacterium]|nr:sulfatase [Acidobacteriota bacterium]
MNRAGVGAICLAAGLLFLLSGGNGACSRSPAPSLLLITIDTLRADHLPAYGYQRPTAPSVDALAARGITLDRVVSAIPETGPSFASLLTGRWPAALGIRGNGRPLAKDIPTLATALSGAGYNTAAFVSGFPLVARLCGLERGFDLYDDNLPDPRGAVEHVQRFAPHTTDAAVAWLKDQGREPFFLWVHYYDVHGDYAPGPPYATQFSAGPWGPRLAPADIPAYQRHGADTVAGNYIDRYDGEIRKIDDQVARLLDQLRILGLTDSTLVVITADHGESLTEHGYYFDHGNELYEPSLKVPLVMAGPGVPDDGRRIARLARLPDLMPTLLELLGQPLPQGIAGVSFRDWWRPGTPPPAPREALSEARFQPYRALTPSGDVGPKLAARDERYTFILRLDGPRVELYDRLSDPGETRNLFADPSWGPGLADLKIELAARLRRRLHTRGGGDPRATVFTQDVRDRLERLATPGAGR